MVYLFKDNLGNNNTFIAACYAVRCGLQDSDIYEVLEWYNTNYCKPKWTKREIDNKVKYSKKIVEYADYFTPRYLLKLLEKFNERAFTWNK